MPLKIGDAVRVKGFHGVACRYRGEEMKDTDDTEWDGVQEPTGRVIVVMVGDDHRYAVDPKDVTPLDEEEFCGECGQIGCGWGGH